MKTLMFIALFSFSLNAYSLEKYVCTTNNLKLEITVTEELEGKFVHWILGLVNDESASLEGRGLWQKEVESDDAFSAYNEETAISYKNKRAVFVSGTNLGDAILFPVCKQL
nr:hypothetical protein BHI3_17550 [Bacteriovorax sp. HI3]